MGKYDPDGRKSRLAQRPLDRFAVKGIHRVIGNDSGGTGRNDPGNLLPAAVQRTAANQQIVVVPRFNRNSPHCSQHLSVRFFLADPPRPQHFVECFSIL